MPTVFSNLGAHPHLNDLEATAMNAHSDGRNYSRHPRGDRGGNEVDTFVTRIESHHRDLPEAQLHARSGAYNRKTPPAPLHSKDVDNQLLQIMLDSAGYECTPTLPSDVEAFTSAMAKSQLIINENLEHSDLLEYFKDPVLGASLAVDSNSTTSWQYTYPFQQIALGYMKTPTEEFFDATVEREVTIGQRPSKVQAFSETMAEAKSISDSKSGPSAVAFKVLYTQVYKSDFVDIAAKRCDHQGDTFTIPIPDLQSAHEDGRELQLFPTKIIFGAGNEWMGSLKVGISHCPDNPDTHYLIDFGASCQLELDFFHYLGLIAGFDPINDIAILSQFFRSFYPRDTFKPPPVIELATLAVAAGYRLERSGWRRPEPEEAPGGPMGRGRQTRAEGGFNQPGRQRPAPVRQPHSPAHRCPPGAFGAALTFFDLQPPRAALSTFSPAAAHPGSPRPFSPHPHPYTSYPSLETASTWSPPDARLLHFGSPGTSTGRRSSGRGWRASLRPAWQSTWPAVVCRLEIH